jgi:hypothetical protein
MNTKKILILATLAAISVGMGSAMAQESAGGVNAMPYETQELTKLNQVLMSKAATTRHEPQFGSSDYSTVTNSPVLQGSDGSGR